MHKKINRKNGAYLIASERQLKALKSPARQEIIDALNATGPSTIAELAELLARAPDSLYLHVKELLRVGLLVECEPRKSGRHVAAVFDLAGRPMNIDYVALGRSPTLFKVVDGAVRLSLRDFFGALGDVNVAVTGRARPARGGRVKGWLDRKELEELNGLVDRIETLLMSGRPGRGRKAYSIGYVMAPVSTRDRRNEE